MNTFSSNEKIETISTDDLKALDMTHYQKSQNIDYFWENGEVMDFREDFCNLMDDNDKQSKEFKKRTGFDIMFYLQDCDFNSISVKTFEEICEADEEKNLCSDHTFLQMLQVYEDQIELIKENSKMKMEIEKMKDQIEKLTKTEKWRSKKNSK